MKNLNSLLYSTFQVGQKKTLSNATLMTFFFFLVSELEFCTPDIVGQLFCLQEQLRAGRNVPLQKSPEG